MNWQVGSRYLGSDKNIYVIHTLGLANNCFIGKLEGIDEGFTVFKDSGDSIVGSIYLTDLIRAYNV